MKDDKKPISPKEALVLITAYCSREERCEYDVLKKLENFYLPTEEIEKIISYLIENKYLNNTRYALAFVNDKMRFNKWGKMKIAYALQQKRIDTETIQNALNSLDKENSYKILLELLKKKQATIKSSAPYELKGKLYRFAASRGFETELISKAIHEITKN